jgi:hypothetical protein
MPKIDKSLLDKHRLDTDGATRKLKIGLGAGSIKGVIIGKKLVDGYVSDVDRMSKTNIVSKYANKTCKKCIHNIPHKH